MEDSFHLVFKRVPDNKTSSKNISFKVFCRIFWDDIRDIYTG